MRRTQTDAGHASRCAARKPMRGTQAGARHASRCAARKPTRGTQADAEDANRHGVRKPTRGTQADTGYASRRGERKPGAGHASRHGHANRHGHASRHGYASRREERKPMRGTQARRAGCDRRSFPPFIANFTKTRRNAVFRRVFCMKFLLGVAALLPLISVFFRFPCCFFVPPVCPSDSRFGFLPPAFVRRIRKADSAHTFSAGQSAAAA